MQRSAEIGGLGSPDVTCRGLEVGQPSQDESKNWCGRTWELVETGISLVPSQFVLRAANSFKNTLGPAFLGRT